MNGQRRIALGAFFVHPLCAGRDLRDSKPVQEDVARKDLLTSILHLRYTRAHTKRGVLKCHQQVAFRPKGPKWHVSSSCSMKKLLLYSPVSDKLHMFYPLFISSKFRTVVAKAQKKQNRCPGRTPRPTRLAKILGVSLWLSNSLLWEITHLVPCFSY